MFKKLLRKILSPLIRDLIEEQLVGSIGSPHLYYEYPMLKIQIVIEGDPNEEHTKFIEIITPGFDLSKNKVKVEYWDDHAGRVILTWIKVVSSTRLGISTKWAANQGENWKDKSRYTVYYVQDLHQEG